MKYRTTLFLFALLLLLPLGEVFGISLMEARNLISAQSMALDRDWLIPHLYTEIRLNKPPLPIWLTVPVFLLNPDPSLLALRLPSILITALLGVFCFDLQRVLSRNTKTAFYSGLVAVSMFMVVDQGMCNAWDIYSVVFMTGCLVSLLHKNKIWIAIGILCMASSVLSKGPVQIYTMFIPFLVSSFIFKKRIYWRHITVISVAGIILGSLWYIYVYTMVPSLAESTAAGEISAWGTKHTAPFYFYLSFPIFAGAWFVPSLVSLGWKWIGCRQEDWPHHAFLLCWFGLSLLLLSLVPEKKERYLLPAFIPFALLTAEVLQSWVYRLKQDGLPRLERILVHVHMGLVALAVLLSCLFIALNHQEYILYCLLFGLLAGGIAFFGFKYPYRIVPVTCLMLLCASFAAFRMGSDRPVVQSITPSYSLQELHHLPQLAGLPFYSLDVFSPLEEWEIGRDITHISTLCAIHESRFVLMDVDTELPDILLKQNCTCFRITERILVQTTMNNYLTLLIVERSD